MNNVPELSVQDLNNKRNNNEDFVLVDVRNPGEYEIANIGGQLIPLDQLPERFDELDRNKEIVVHCHHGGRSARATQFLIDKGYPNVKNLAGGIDQWSLQIDNKIPRY